MSLRRILPVVSLLQRVAQDEWRLRLAGTEIERRWGRTLTGINYTDIMTPKAAASTLCEFEAVCARPCGSWSMRHLELSSGRQVRRRDAPVAAARLRRQRHLDPQLQRRTQRPLPARAGPVARGHHRHGTAVSRHRRRHPGMGLRAETDRRSLQDLANAPAQRLAGAEGAHREIAFADRRRHGSSSRRSVTRSSLTGRPVEGRAVERGEGLEPVERAFLLEHLGIDLERRRRGEDAGAAAGGLLGRDRVRRAVGAEKEMRRCPRSRRGARRGGASRAWRSAGNRDAAGCRPAKIALRLITR